jgi:hypothetical protein
MQHVHRLLRYQTGVFEAMECQGDVRSDATGSSMLDEQAATSRVEVLAGTKLSSSSLLIRPVQYGCS